MQHTKKHTVSGNATYSFDNDHGTGIHSDGAGLVQILSSGTEIAEYGGVNNSRPAQWLSLSITGGAASTGVFASLANPFGYNVLITDAKLVIATQSAAASTLDIGCGANATTSNDGLFDGLSGAAAGQFSAGVSGGTNGDGCQSWTTSLFLNVAEASGNVDALVATLWVEVIRA